MGTTIPLRLLYTMAVILAALTIIFLILTMVLKISDLLGSSSSPRTDVEPRVETTVVERTVTVEKPEDERKCGGDSDLFDAKGLTGRFAYDCNGDIFRMNLATGELARLSHGPNYLWFAWSSDGEKIAWADYEFGNLWVTDVGGASPSQQGNESFATLPEWSPDGLYTVNTDGTDLTKISRPRTDPETNVRENDRWYDPTYSPDGETIAFIKGMDDWGIHTMNPDGTDVRQVTHDAGDIIQSWSPNGEKILFEKISNGHRDLFVINADGTEKQRLTTGQSSEDMNGIHNVLWLP